MEEMKGQGNKINEHRWKEKRKNEGGRKKYKEC
jgi:hypothetical protein